jgi:phosphatidylinositol-3-phosphatase
MPAVDFHAPLLGPAGEPCAGCGEPLAADQRYCLSCGTRRGPARLEPLVMARGRTWSAPRAGVRGSTGAPPRTGLVARTSGGVLGAAWSMPSPRVAGIATLLVLGFGIVAGAAAGPRADATLASASTPQRIIVVRQPAPAPTATAASEPKASPTSSNPPTSESAPESTQPGAGGSESSAPAADPAPQSAAKKHPAAEEQPSPNEDAKGPAVKHVWLVTLTGHTLAEALADPSPMPYLSGTLRPKGLVLAQYKAIGPGALANRIALISGQVPTADQQAGCPAYTDVDPVAHTGCVLGKDVESLPAQLAAGGRTWRVYAEDADAAQPPNTCAHPAPGGPTDPLIVRDPVLFFHAIVDTPDCAPNIAGISRLVPDSADPESAPSFSLVAPNACHDGTDQPCPAVAPPPADPQAPAPDPAAPPPPTPPAGLAAADTWLQQQLDPLLASKAYADGGVIVVTFDVGADPATPVGALVLSSFVKAGATVDTPHTHTDLLRSVEDLFELDPLGAAKAKTVEPFGDDVWSVTNPSR